jgi:hypothetical protein
MVRLALARAFPDIQWHDGVVLYRIYEVKI